MNILQKTAQLALYITLAYVNPGDTVIDATAGNGNDTLTLANAVGESGSVIAIDIQETAIQNTRKLLLDHGISNAQFILGNFKSIDLYAANYDNISAVIFNLGFLPGGDKNITSQKEDSLTAIKKALNVIKPGGIVTITMYPGHSQGEEEKRALLNFSKTLSATKYHSVYFNMHNQKDTAPEILAITRKK